MRRLPALVLAFAPLAAAAHCTPGPEPWITLELVAAEPASGEPVEVIDIDRSGCLSVRYASFDTRAGLYRRQLASDEQQAIARQIAADALLDFDSATVRAAIDAGERALLSGLRGDGAPLHSVQCADVLRVRIDEAGATMQAEWSAPRQIAARHPAVAGLAALVALHDTLRRAAEAPGRERVAAVTP